MGTIAFCSTNHSEGATSTASSPLDNRSSRLQLPPSFGSFDHGQCHSVLHATCRVSTLPLHPDLSHARRSHLPQTKKRSIAYGCQYTGIRCHSNSLLGLHSQHGQLQG